MHQPVYDTARQTPYLFFRNKSFYTINMKDDQDAIANAQCNPGTIRVEDIHGNIIWQRQ